MAPRKNFFIRSKVLWRLHRGRGTQARDGVLAEAGFQSGIHGLGAGRLREGGRPDERAGDLRLQDAV